MHDPRSQEEKARAALKRNLEMGNAPKQSPLTRQPLVTNETFGDHGGRSPEEVERGQTARDSEDAGRGGPGTPNDPDRHGYGHADSNMGREHVEDLGEALRTVTGRPAAPTKKD